MLKCAIIDEC